QAGKKVASIKDCLLGIGRNYAGTHHRARRNQCEIDNWRKIYIEAQGAARLANYFAVFAKELAIVAGENVGSGRGRTDEIAETIDGAAFHIDTREQARRAARLTAFE